jgi:excisionase family DNA binding protein
MEATAVVRTYLSYSEAEQYTGLNRVTLWRAVRAGALRADGPAGAIRFHRAELDRWMQARDTK